jgi:hypothetical protein
MREGKLSPGQVSSGSPARRATAVGGGVEEQIGQGAGGGEAGPVHQLAEHQPLRIDARRCRPLPQPLAHQRVLQQQPEHGTRHPAQDLQPLVEAMGIKLLGPVEAGEHHPLPRQAQLTNAQGSRSTRSL